MMRSASFAFGALATILTIGGGACGSATDPESALDEARSRWAQRAPASYSVIVTRSCECLPGAAGSVLVSVRNGIVESRQYLWTGTAVAAVYANAFPAVEGLFSLIDEAVRNGTKPLEARYDASLGYPTRIALGDPAVDAPLYAMSEFRTK
jgi:hypothetical protein